MKNNSVVDLYLENIRKALFCSRKTKTEILSQLRVDVEDFAETYSGDLSLTVLESHFGHASELALSLLHETEYQTLKKQISKRKVIAASVIATCCLLVIAILVYIAYDAQKKKEYQSGYIVETIYESVDATPPPFPENAQIY